MYKSMLSKLKDIKDKFVDEETIDNIFYEEDWECMGYNQDMNKLIYIEAPMGKEIDLYIELDKKPLGWGELAPNTKIKIKSIEKKWWNS